MTSWPRLVRRIYPTVTQCPRCAGGAYVASGSSRVGLLRYRTCTGCGVAFKVLPIALELHDAGARISRIEPCRDVTWTSRVGPS